MSDSQVQEYRAELIRLEQKAQESYDKHIIALSGGALGISFAFVTDLVGAGPLTAAWLLLVSWGAWAASISVVLASFLFSNLALRRAIQQVDTEQIWKEHVGGRYDTITHLLNVLGGVLFLCGVISVVAFVALNLESVNG